MRLYTDAAVRSLLVTAKKNTGSSGSPAFRQTCSSALRSIATASTAAFAAMGTKRNGTPQDTICAGSPAARSAASMPSAAARPGSSSVVPPNCGIPCCIHANDRPLAFHSSETGVGPTPSSKTNS